MSHSSFVEVSSKENQQNSQNIIKYKHNSPNQSKLNESISTEPTIFDSRVISQQNSPNSISKIRDQFKPLTPQNVFSINQCLEQVGSYCLQHKKQKRYVCVTCNVRLCPECSIYQSKHKNHQFRRYQNELQNYSMRIQKFFILLGEQRDLLLKNKNKLVLALEAIKEKEEIKIGLMEKNLSLMMQQYQNTFDQVEKKQELLLKNMRETEDHKENYSEFMEILKNSSKMELISEKGAYLQNQIQQNTREVEEIKVQKFDKCLQKNISKPEWHEFQVNIQNFDEVSQQKELIIEEFNCLNVKWKLKIYPNGYITPSSPAIMRQTKYLSVYVEMLDCPYEKSSFTFKVVLINQEENGTNLQKQFKSEFKVGQSWGYDRYTRVQSLYRKGFIGKNGNLLLKLCTSWSSFNQGIANVSHFIKYKEALFEKNKQKIKNLKQKLQEKERQKQRKVSKSKIIRYVSYKNQQLLRQSKNRIVAHRKTRTNF